MANPFPNLPDVLTLKNGKKVTTPDDVVEAAPSGDRGGFRPRSAGPRPEERPKVTWTVTSTANAMAGNRPVVGKQLMGHVDNSVVSRHHCGHSDDAGGPGGRQGTGPGDDHVRRRHGAPGRSSACGAVDAMVRQARPAAAARRPLQPTDPPSTQQLIADGWGYASLNPTSIQADNGAGLTKGIIGLVNKGQLRKPDDWGALRAWAWGASRGLDYLETDKTVDAKHVGIEGVSRYGKAALVTMATTALRGGADRLLR